MDVVFEHTGSRRYATVVAVKGQAVRRLDPAPGFDEEIPHDLVHYVVEAELGLTGGVFGRAARGGGMFREEAGGRVDAREQRRQRRQREQLEARLQQEDRAGDMGTSEHLAGLCHAVWKKRRNPGVRTPEWLRPIALSGEEEAVVERVLVRLDEVAPLWGEGSVRFVWPSPVPVRGR